MPNWLYIIILVFVIYIALSIIMYVFQERMLFKPEKLPEDFKFHYKNQRIEEYNLKTPDGAVINGLHFMTEKPRGIVLYLKGNSKSIKGWGKFAVDFTRNGFDVFMVDYRGFGKSTGKRSQHKITNDLQAIYNEMKQKVEEKYIILYGRSLGSGFATKLASMNRPRKLILDAPYYSLTKLTARYAPFMPFSIIMRYPMPTYKWIKYVQCPIHILHGTNDKIIPYKTSVKLSKINPKLTRLYTVIGGGHKDLNNFESYHKMLGEILNDKPEELDLKDSSIHVIHSSR